MRAPVGGRRERDSFAVGAKRRGSFDGRVSRNAHGEMMMGVVGLKIHRKNHRHQPTAHLSHQFINQLISHVNNAIIAREGHLSHTATDEIKETCATADAYNW